MGSAALRLVAMPPDGTVSVPAAAPLPRGPSLVTLDSARALLTGSGCPVCWYAREASDRHLAWFALEAHADAGTITRLCASLGMCAVHTRRVTAQPGAGARLTVVYRYVLTAGRDRLGRKAAKVAPCPACEHDDRAHSRALETLLEGLDDDAVRHQYRRGGGLCLPHLRAAMARASRELSGWLHDTALVALATSARSPDWMAGIDDDADTRAVLRRATRDDRGVGPPGCTACLAAAQAEYLQLTRPLPYRVWPRPQLGLVLCRCHLNDMIPLVGRDAMASFLAWQASCLAAGAAADPGGPGLGHRPGRWPARRRGGPPAGDCPVCFAGREAVLAALEDLRANLLAAGHRQDLCLRHLLSLRAIDDQAGRSLAAGGIEFADSLLTELEAAIGKAAWARRGEPRGAEAMAWRRAAAFLDGAVYFGRMPR